MLHRHPNYYPGFRCLGGACPDTCCRDWDIVLDEETLSDYQHAPASLAHRLQESLTTDEEGDTCFRLDRRGFCTMLTSDGLCAIQTSPSPTSRPSCSLAWRPPGKRS